MTLTLTWMIMIHTRLFISKRILIKQKTWLKKKFKEDGVEIWIIEDIKTTMISRENSKKMRIVSVFRMSNRKRIKEGSMIQTRCSGQKDRRMMSRWTFSMSLKPENTMHHHRHSREVFQIPWYKQIKLNLTNHRW